MVKHSFYLVAVLALIFVKTALAAQPLEVKPWVYDPDHLGICTSAWVAKQGLPDAGNSNHALYLTKFGDTYDNAASGAAINFSGKLTQLGFDYRNDGHCGAGAPRFNVFTTTGVYYFYGCHYGVHTPVPGNPNWTRVRFAAANGFPSDGVTGITDFNQITVTSIEIVFDEGPTTNFGEDIVYEDDGVTQNPGFVYLDNIDINGTLVGKPGAAK